MQVEEVVKKLNVKPVRETVKMAREIIDSTTKDMKTQVFDMPVGKEFNDGTGEKFWRKHGWIPYSEYVTKKELESLRQEKALLEAAKKSEASAKAIEASRKGKKNTKDTEVDEGQNEPTESV